MNQDNLVPRFDIPVVLAVSAMAFRHLVPAGSLLVLHSDALHKVFVEVILITELTSVVIFGVE